MSFLDAKGMLLSDFWFDQPNAIDMVEQRAEQSGVDASLLRDFVVDGYMIVKATEELEGLASALNDDVDRAWQEMSGKAIYSALAKRRTMLSGLDPERHRAPGYRIADIHGFSKAACDLILSESVFRYINALFGEPAIAFQSLYFEWGSEQSLHRDPMFVRTNPPSALLATWLALEDVHTDAGPLMYVPGSHRYPWYEFVKGDVKLDKNNDKREHRIAFEKKYLADMKSSNHALKHLVCQKGDVLIWHGNLLHGGSRHLDYKRTRKSLVTHYSIVSAMNSVRNSIFSLTPESGVIEQMVGETNRILKRSISQMFEAPLDEAKLKGLVGQGYISTPDS